MFATNLDSSIHRASTEKFGNNFARFQRVVKFKKGSLVFHSAIKDIKFNSSAITTNTIEIVTIICELTKGSASDFQGFRIAIGTKRASSRNSEKRNKFSSRRVIVIG